MRTPSVLPQGFLRRRERETLYDQCVTQRATPVVRTPFCAAGGAEEYGVLRLRERIRVCESVCCAQDDSLVVCSESINATLFIFRPALTVSGSVGFQRSIGSVFNSPLTRTAFCFLLRPASVTDAARPI